MGAGGRQGGQLSRSAGGALPQHTRPGEVEAAGHQHHLMTGVLQICQHRYQLGHPGNIGFACVVGQSGGAYFDHNAFFLRQLHYTLLQVT